MIHWHAHNHTVVLFSRKLVELAKPTEWTLQGTLNSEVLPIVVSKTGDTFEVVLIFRKVNFLQSVDRYF